MLTPDTDLLLLKNNLLKLEGVIKVTAENSEIKTIVNKLQELEKDVLRHNKYRNAAILLLFALSELKPLSCFINNRMATPVIRDALFNMKNSMEEFFPDQRWTSTGEPELGVGIIVTEVAKGRVTMRTFPYRARHVCICDG